MVTKGFRVMERRERVKGGVSVHHAAGGAIQQLQGVALQLQISASQAWLRKKFEHACLTRQALLTRTPGWCCAQPDI